MNRYLAEKYLGRIGIGHWPDASLQTLQLLQKKHLLSVPFENLDIHLHIPIILDTEKFCEKVVNRRRGGFCYELNGLFNELLISLGYSTSLVSARAFQAPDQYGAEFDHLAIIVELDGKKYIADVGFGEFALGPLVMERGTQQQDERGIFRIEKYDEIYSVIRKLQDNGEWVAEYIFSEIPRSLNEFEGMCNYHQHDSRSHFTKKMLCSLPVEGGRITLTNTSLKITQGKEVRVEPIADNAAFEEALRQYFNIDITVPAV